MAHQLAKESMAKAGTPTSLSAVGASTLGIGG
jgi:hypothetical protein